MSVTYGSNGQNGADGALGASPSAQGGDGTSGEAGGNATDTGAIDPSTPNFVAAGAFSGRAGASGNGGGGASGGLISSSYTAQYDQYGNTIYQWTYFTYGPGGAGGNGADAASGGVAQALITSPFQFLDYPSIYVAANASGRSYDPVSGGRGGDGGFDGSYPYQGSITIISPGSTYQQTGGVGGRGGNGGDGASGSDTYSLVSEQIIARTDAQAYTYLQAVSYGGNGSGGGSGGSGGWGAIGGAGGNGGNGGRGGNAQAITSDNTVSLSGDGTYQYSSIFLEATAYGGNGGGGVSGGQGGRGSNTSANGETTVNYGASGAAGHGGIGGNALAEVSGNSVDISAAQAPYLGVFLQLNAVAGQGGLGGSTYSGSGDGQPVSQGAGGANGQATIRLANNIISVGGNSLDLRMDGDANAAVDIRGNSFTGNGHGRLQIFNNSNISNAALFQIDLGAGTFAVNGGVSTISGFDTFWAGPSLNTNTYGGVRIDVRGTASADTLHAQGNTHLYGQDGDDTLYADSLNNSGSNQQIGLYGGDGNDLLIPELIFLASITLDGGAGIDTISFAPSINPFASPVNLSLGVASPQVFGNGTANIANVENLIGSVFSDTLEGNGGNNRLDGGGDNYGPGDTVSYAHAGAAVSVSLALQGKAQNTKGAGTDTLIGFTNLQGSTFNDTLTGDANNNVIEGGAGNDRLNGGLGIDTLSYASASTGVTVSLAITAAQNTGGAGLDTVAAFENLTGSAFNDMLTGSTKSNVIDGGDGDDVINGGVSNDTLIGGAGADRFVFLKTADSTVTKTDSIQDFSQSEGDLIDLSAIDANSKIAGNQAFTLAGSVFTKQAGQLIISYAGDGYRWLIQGDTNGDGKADFALIAGLLTTPLTANDFLL